MLKHALIAIAVVIAIILIFKIHEVLVIMKYSLDEDDFEDIVSDDPEKVERVARKVTTILENKLIKSKKDSDETEDSEYMSANIYLVESSESANVRLKNHHYINNSYIIISSLLYNKYDLEENEELTVGAIVDDKENVSAFCVSRDKHTYASIGIMQVCDDSFKLVETNKEYVEIFCEFCRRNGITIEKIYSDELKRTGVESE